jgi:hypothetical protein
LQPLAKLEGVKVPWNTAYPTLVAVALCIAASCSREDDIGKQKAEIQSTSSQPEANVARPELPGGTLSSPMSIREAFVFVETAARLPAPGQRPHVRRIYQEVYPHLESLPSSSAAFAGLIPHDTWSSLNPEQLAVHILGPQGYGWGLLHAESKRVCVKVLENNRDELKRLVTQDLEQNDKTTKARALHAIGKFRFAEFFGPVLAIFETDADLWERAAYTLSDIGNPQAIRPMMQKYPTLRGNPTFGLLRSLQRRHGAEPLLIERLHSVDPEERWRATYSLAESGDPSLIPYVERLIHDEDERVREAAANIGFCIDTGDSHLVRPILVEALHDPSPTVRRFAACCFAQRKDAVCAPVLLELLKDGSMESWAHSNIVQAVQSLAGTYFGYHVGSDAWQPTTENNQAAIERFAEWIEQDKEGRAASAKAGLAVDLARIDGMRRAAKSIDK